MTRHDLNPRVVVVWFVLAIAGWIIFGPVQLGGPTAYVIVAGNSMEPLFQRGDLVVMRQASHYAVGNAVTYTDPKIGRIFHRIIDRDGSRFILQGDNNSWLDPYEPTADEIIGKLWYHLPGSGRWLEWLRLPTNLLLLSFIIGGLFATSMLQDKQAQTPPRRLLKKIRQRMKPFRDNRGDWLFLWGVVGFAALLLGAFAFTRPMQRVVYDDVRYEHQATFEYTAAAPTGVYDWNNIRTGDPIFRQLTSLFETRLDYRLAAPQTADLHGRYRLNAQISDNTGWRRVIPLQPETEFSGDAFQTSGQIELADVQALITSLESQAGVQRSFYTLSIVADMVVEGTIGGQQVTETFQPRLDFRFDNLQLYLTDRSLDYDDGLIVTQMGVLQRPRLEDDTLLILGFQPTVEMARWISVIALIVAVTAVALPTLLLDSHALDNETDRIQSQYAPFIITVRDSQLHDASRLMDVDSIDDLARLADNGGHVILREVWHEGDIYYVQAGDVAYRYMAGGNGPAEPLLRANPQMLTAYDHTVAEWVRALDMRNQESPGHTQRVTTLFMQLARAMGVAEKDLTYARWGALLHDVGTIKVPDEILQKPGELTAVEWEIMRQHPVYAKEILSEISYLRGAIDIPYSHHEKWDGTGYPQGLAGEEIPLVARIFAVVDVWDRLTSDRPYAAACSPEEAADILREQAGKQFDPAVVDAFFNL